MTPLAALDQVRAPDTSWTIEPAPGARLHAEAYLPTRNPSAVVVLVHGFSVFTGVQRPVAAALADAGFVSVLFDCRGHGRSSGRRGHINRFSDFVDDLSAVATDAHKRYPTEGWAVVGHSHGATVALAAVLGPRALRPDALVVAAPFLGLRQAPPWPKRWAAKPLSVLWPTLAFANGLDPALATRNEQAVRHFRDEPLIHHVATPRWFVEVGGAQRAILAAAPQLRTPTYLVLAGDERVVDNATAETFAAAAGSCVTQRTWPGLRHELFIEPEAADVVREVQDWLSGQLQSRQRSQMASPG